MELTKKLAKITDDNKSLRSQSKLKKPPRASKGI